MLCGRIGYCSSAKEWYRLVLYLAALRDDMREKECNPFVGE